MFVIKQVNFTTFTKSNYSQITGQRMHEIFSSCILLPVLSFLGSNSKWKAVHQTFDTQKVHLQKIKAAVQQTSAIEAVHHQNVQELYRLMG